MTNDLEWSWETDDFAALWLSEAQDRFPRPLYSRSRFQYAEDCQAHLARVRANYSQDDLIDIKRAFEVVTSSDVRIEIRGGTTKTSDGSTRQYRILGVRNEVSAAVLSQITTYEIAGPIRLRLCHPDHLPARIVHRMVPAEPGRQPQAEFHQQDIMGDRDPYFDDSRRARLRDRYREFVGRPADGGGSAALYVGPFAAEANPLHFVEWRDITEDGRYTELRTLDRIRIRPTTPKDLATHFATWIDKARDRLSADADVW
ncbi:ESX secretion-associated protein EspG [Nocardia panacis]|uniref:ESX secretion-associated protein EspG n=1 Tax=Nocardia panacis TaxID=2340916 RepID=A0A3A4KA44_9NOCA|nr:ESX secretion-associated protein EspG [Nocardia panacis]RJO76690.1 ESX secretion-associated protein EspG [Nocardia panacis]